MSFNAVIFLIFFLPVCLLFSMVADRRYKNSVLLAASLVFFAWGQWFYLPLMLGLIAANFFLGRRIELLRDQEEASRRMLVLAIGLNLGILVVFKLLVSYGAAVFVALPAGEFDWLVKNPLPLGLSYIAFQLISYLVDIYNEQVESEKDFLDFALYVLLFPKILTGPIVRYREIADQLKNRAATSQDVAEGIRRFILGMAKKVLIADQLARVVNPAFALSSPNFSPGIAWVVVIGYSVQLYFDFSGYVDMAVGLGRMFGFSFPENFNYPYISKSISEFWRRWHITLSNWFRDYVFYPLEFSRRGSRFRQPVNVLIVFLLTGLWHGLTLNFAIWGLIHGAAIALETLGLGRWLKKTWAPIQHLYALAVILVGWVFFRSPTPGYALALLARLAGSTQGITPLPFSQTMPLPLIENSVWTALALGILLCLPVFPALSKGWQRTVTRYPLVQWPARLGVDLFLLLMLVGAFSAMIGSVHTASIYAGF